MRTLHYVQLIESTTAKLVNSCKHYFLNRLNNNKQLCVDYKSDNVFIHIYMLILYIQCIFKYLNYFLFLATYHSLVLNFPLVV